MLRHNFGDELLGCGQCWLDLAADPHEAAFLLRVTWSLLVFRGALCLGSQVKCPAPSS